MLRAKKAAAAAPLPPTTWRGGLARSLADRSRVALSREELESGSWRVEFRPADDGPPLVHSASFIGGQLHIDAGGVPVPYQLFNGGRGLHIHVFPELAVTRQPNTWAWVIQNHFVTIASTTTTLPHSGSTQPPPPTPVVSVKQHYAMETRSIARRREASCESRASSSSSNASSSSSSAAVACVADINGWRDSADPLHHICACRNIEADGDGQFIRLVDDADTVRMAASSEETNCEAPTKATKLLSVEDVFPQLRLRLTHNRRRRDLENSLASPYSDGNDCIRSWGTRKKHQQQDTRSLTIFEEKGSATKNSLFPCTEHLRFLGHPTKPP